MAPSGPDGPPACASAPSSVSKIRAFYTFAIDLGDYQDVSDSSIESLQELRASGGLLPIYESGLIGDHGYKSQAQGIVSDAGEAVRRGGKVVWSDTFLTSRAAWFTPCPESFQMGPEQLRINGRMSRLDGSLSGWEFDTIRGYLSPDGVVVFTASFRQDNSSQLDDVVRSLRVLSDYARKMFSQHAISLVSNGSRVSKLLERHGVTPGSKPNAEKVRSHRTLFVESFQCASGRHCDAHRVRDNPAVAGLMNLATWYDTYHQEYRERLANKEFGYRSNELYLVDRDTTLCVQDGFWKPDDPLRIYMGNVLQAIEYHVGLQALLRGQLQYARKLYSTSTTDESSMSAVEGVRRSRAILSGAYESLNYSVLVLHGFTRRLLRGLDEESEISAILQDVERRVENVSDAVSLQASVSTSQTSEKLQEFGNGLNRKVLLATIVGAIAGVLALIVTLVALVLPRDSGTGNGQGSTRPTSSHSSGSLPSP